MTPLQADPHDTDKIGASTSSTLSAGVFTLCRHAPPYGRGVSGVMENRAAVFTSQPQDVEVYRDGAWWPGSLLGWRHDADGGCQVWVRVSARGAEETAWTALDYLRLPEAAPVARRHSGARRPADLAGDSPLTATMAAIRAVPAPVGRSVTTAPAPSEITATMNLFPVRDLEDPHTGEPPVVRSGGRHRAPAPAGRHRATDTGVWPAVRPEAEPEPSLPVAAPAFADAEVDLFTRPMRLDDLPGRVPQPRRTALEGRLAGR